MNRDELCKGGNSYGCQLWEMRSWDGGESGNSLPRTGGEGPQSRSAIRATGSPQRTRDQHIPCLISEVPDAKMVFCFFQSAAEEAGGAQGSAHMAVTGEGRVSVGAASKSPGTAPKIIN